MSENRVRVREIFIKIKKGHELWKTGDADYQERLEKAFDPFFVELEELGVSRHFSESLLFFGKEFVESLSGKKDSKKKEKLSNRELEKIWGAKPRPATEKEKREANLAKKSDVHFYTALPMKGGRVGIKALTFNQK